MQDIIQTVVETEKEASKRIKKAEAEADAIIESARKEAEQLRLDILNETKTEKEKILREGEELCPPAGILPAKKRRYQETRRAGIPASGRLYHRKGGW